MYLSYFCALQNISSGNEMSKYLTKGQENSTLIPEAVKRANLEDNGIL